jgi:HEAT repeat protein
MMCGIGIAEIAVFIIGIVLLVRGRFNLTPNRVVRSGPARFIGVLLLLPLLVGEGGPLLYAAAVGAAKGMELAKQRKQFRQADADELAQEIQTPLRVIHAAGSLGPLLLALVIALATAAPRRDEDAADQAETVAEVGDQRSPTEGDRPPGQVAQKSPRARVRWIVIGGLGVPLLLACGGVALFFDRIWLAFEKPLSMVPVGNMSEGGGENQPGGKRQPPARGGDPQPQPGPQGIWNVNQALEALKSDQRGRQDDALRWLTTAPLYEARRAEVARAVEKRLPEHRKDAGYTLDLEVLARWGTAESVPALIEVLEQQSAQGDQRRGSAAVRALGERADVRAAPALVANWRYVGPDGTRWALERIGRGAEKDVLPYLTDPRPYVHDGALGVLRRYGTKNEVLVERALADLAGDNWGRRGGAAACFVQTDPPPAQRPAVVKALERLLAEALALDNHAFHATEGGEPWSSPQKAATQAAAALASRARGDEDLAALKRVIDGFDRYDPPASCAELVADALVRINSEESAALLVREARHALARPHAARGLQKMGTTGRRALHKALDDPDPALRLVLPQLYGGPDFGNGQFAIDQALGDLRSKDPVRHKTGLAELGRWLPGGENDAQISDVASLIRPYLTSDDVELRELAEAAICRWASKEDVPALLKLLGRRGMPREDRNRLIRKLATAQDERAAEALVALVGGPDGDAAAAALVLCRDAAKKPLLKTLDIPDPKKRAVALQLLPALGVRENLQFKIAWLDANSDQKERRRSGLSQLASGAAPVPGDRGADVLNLAEKRLDDPDAETQVLAVTLLARHATKAQVPLLLKLLDDKGKGARGEVILALGRLKEETAPPPLVKALDEQYERESAEQALRAIGRPAEKAVLECLKNSSNGLTRFACLRVLAQVGGPDSLPALEALTKDEAARRRGLADEAEKTIAEIKKRK